MHGSHWANLVREEDAQMEWIRTVVEVEVVSALVKQHVGFTLW